MTAAVIQDLSFFTQLRLPSRLARPSHVDVALAFDFHVFLTHLATDPLGILDHPFPDADLFLDDGPLLDVDLFIHDGDTDLLSLANIRGRGALARHGMA